MKEITRRAALVALAGGAAGALLAPAVAAQPAVDVQAAIREALEAERARQREAARVRSLAKFLLTCYSSRKSATTESRLETFARMDRIPLDTVRRLYPQAKQEADYYCQNRRWKDGTR